MMTLIMALGNTDYVIQISDRRLSSGNIILSEDENKATCLLCKDGKFSIGFTGLAKYWSFNIQELIINALYSSGFPDYEIHKIIPRFTRKVESEILNNSDVKDINASEKCISIMLTGFQYIGRRPRILNVIITNYQDFKSGVDLNFSRRNFAIRYEYERNELFTDSSLIQFIGFRSDITKDDINQLRYILYQRNSYNDSVEMATKLFREIAGRKNSNNLIGKHVIATIIQNNINEPIQTKIFHDKGRNEFIEPNYVVLQGVGNSFMVKDLKLKISKNDCE